MKKSKALQIGYARVKVSRAVQAKASCMRLVGCASIDHVPPEAPSVCGPWLASSDTRGTLVGDPSICRCDSYSF